MSSARERLVEAIRKADKQAEETGGYIAHGVMRAIVEACAEVASEYSCGCRPERGIRAALKEAERGE